MEVKNDQIVINTNSVEEAKQWIEKNDPTYFNNYQGDVFLIIPGGSTAQWEDNFANPRSVESVLNDHHILAFHVLAEIQSKVIIDVPSLVEWYSRSLAYKQTGSYSDQDAQGLLEDLKEMNMIEYNGGLPFITPLGQASAWLYHSPYNIHQWHINFNHIFNNNIPIDDEILSWALADIPSNNPGYIAKAYVDITNEWKWRLNNHGVTLTNAALSVIAIHAGLTGEKTSGAITAIQRQLTFDIDRVIQALSLIDGRYAQWNQKDLWQTLPARIRYGIPAKMAELTKVKGIGGVRAKLLWTEGIETPKDLTKNSNFTTLKKLFKHDLAKNIRTEALKVVTNQN